MEWKNLWRKLFRPPFLTAQCGHPVTKRAKITAFGETIHVRFCFDTNGVTQYCAECLKEMAIPCAWCGKPIFIHDPITLYSPRDPAYVPPQGAVTYAGDPNALVGCLRFDCADTGADRSGFWTPEGVQRVLSPLEICLLTNDVVMTNNLRDPSEAMYVDGKGNIEH